MLENEYKIKITTLRKEVLRLKRVLSRISELGSRAKSYYKEDDTIKAEATMGQLIVVALNNQQEIEL